MEEGKVILLKIENPLGKNGESRENISQHYKKAYKPFSLLAKDRNT